MLIPFVLAYLAITIAIGLYAARRVQSSKDYLVAGRSLPLYMNTATVFATWFGAETVLSVSATFAKEGLVGVHGDPFGASACLVLAALLFARLFYRMNLLTIGDFYKQRFGKGVEVLTSLTIVISYLGWTSAQMTALGLVIHTLSGGAVPLGTGIVGGAVVVLVYTIFGGMWSVAFTDLLQTVVIVIGLSLVAWLVAEMAGGAGIVLERASAEGKLQFWPDDARGYWTMASAFLAFAFGSIPQQDVFQRMTSAKNERVAVQGTVLGGVIYFVFSFVPIFIAYAALVAFPELNEKFAAEEVQVIQQVLPELVLGKMPAWAQVMFFGALLSAILSTASGALLAPTALFTENVIRPFAPKLGDKQMLLLMRVLLVTFTLAGLVFALNSNLTIKKMVQNAYNVTLVGAFVPLLAGSYWKRANTQGAMLSILAGLGTWMAAQELAPDAMIPPNLLGLFASAIGMVLGTYAPEVMADHGLSIEASIRSAQSQQQGHAHAYADGKPHSHLQQHPPLGHGPHGQHGPRHGTGDHGE